MTGIEFVVGYLVAWAVRKARRVGHRADGEVDHALDAGMDRLHDEHSAGRKHSSCQLVQANPARTRSNRRLHPA